MPTFDTPNSTQSYSSAESYGVRIYGAGGGDGDGIQTEDIDRPEGDGGKGGYIAVTVPAGTAIDILIGAGGGRTGGGNSPHYDGGNGRSWEFALADSGGGGGSTAIIRQSDSAVLAVADGGGGGAAVDNNGGAQSGGGGGARGGSGGEVESGKSGNDGAGSGNGGDGGDVNEFGFDFSASDGNDGGQTASGIVTLYDQSTGGGNAGDAVVEIVEAKPSTPTGVSQAVQDDDTIDVSWNSVSNADSYRIEVQEDGGAWNFAGSTGGTNFTYNASSSTNTHRFRVQSKNIAGTSGYDYSQTVATDPSGLNASTNGINSIDLSWSGVQGTNEYQIQRSTGSGFSAVDTVTGTTDTDTGLNAGTEYFYRVVAVYSGTNSQPSNEASAVTDIPAPTLTVLDTSTAGQIVISWDLNANIQSGTVRIFRSTDGSLGTEVATISDLSTTSWTDTGVADGTEYFYTVRTETSTTFADSNQESATTVLPPPTSLISTGTGDETIDVEWTASHNAGQTRVEYRPTDASAWEVSDTVGRTTETATIGGLRNGEEYDVRVVAVTADAEEVDR